MKVATRLALAAGLLVALLAAVTIYQLGRLRAVGRAAQELAGVDFRAATGALELARSADLLDEAVRKLFVLRDRGYAELVVGVRDAIGRRLAALAELPLAPAAAAGLGAATAAWRAFPLAGGDAAAALSRCRSDDAETTLAAALDAVAGVRAGAEALLAAGRDEIEGKRNASVASVAAAQRMAAAMVAAALAVTVAVVLLTVRSIVRPLRQLVGGTQAVARGEFATRLEAEGADEFAALAGDFNRMVERLGELDELKKRFVSHVSHELKTPIVAMQETTSLLLDGEPGPLTDGQRRMLSLNLEAATRLGRMISALLDISRLEAGVVEVDLRAWPLREVVEAAAAELETWAAERGVRLAVAVPPLRVLCDRDRVIQVLVNLLDNAVRHSGPGAAVEVSAGPGGDRRVRVAVADHGPGIAASDREHVFARFRQVASERPRGGVGLGLAICREIVTAHGGRISVSDTPGGGATFVFDLASADGGGGA